MSQARPRRSSRRHRPAQAETPRRPRSPWLMALLAGLCFGLGYGITGRLLCAGVAASKQPLGQPFEVKPHAGNEPGEPADALRRSGQRDRRGDLEKLETGREAQAGEAKRAQEVKERQAVKRRRMPPAGPWRRKNAACNGFLPDEPSTAAPSPPPRDFPQRSARPSYPPRPDLPQFGKTSGLEMSAPQSLIQAALEPVAGPHRQWPG